MKIVDWPKRPAEHRRDELEAENAELKRKNNELEIFLETEVFRADGCQTGMDEARRENAELRKLVEQMKEWLEGGCIGCCEKDTDTCSSECKVKKLIEDAGRLKNEP